MDLLLDKKLAEKYTSQSQKIRVLTESWVSQQVYCPNCGRTDVGKYGNNRPVADFFCANCKEEYELKSKRDAIGTRIVDGAYRTMIERLQSAENPNLFMLTYDIQDPSVLDFLVIPKHFFVPEIIEKRKPLAETACRAGWVGCNISLLSIPQTGKIFFIRDRVVTDKNVVIAEWQKTLFLREEKETVAKGWLLDIMLCVDRFGDHGFSLEEIYACEPELARKHPDNHHIRDKIRQQLQVLRDKGYLEFMGRGGYRKK